MDEEIEVTGILLTGLEFVRLAAHLHQHMYQTGWDWMVAKFGQRHQETVFTLSEYAHFTSTLFGGRLWNTANDWRMFAPHGGYQEHNDPLLNMQGKPESFFPAMAKLERYLSTQQHKPGLHSRYSERTKIMYDSRVKIAASSYVFVSVLPNIEARKAQSLFHKEWVLPLLVFSLASYDFDSAVISIRRGFTYSVLRRDDELNMMAALSKWGDFHTAVLPGSFATSFATNWAFK